MFSSYKNAFSPLPVVEMSRKFVNFMPTLMRSWSNRILSVRRVTQDNQGKKTAGVDGFKSLSPAARLELARELKLTGKSQPTRRVWIPKPGSNEKRPLGIPVMYDRALQAVVKSARLAFRGGNF
jgi:RNA-directed DNA polymerase